MWEKIVSILFALVMLFAACTRDLAAEGQIALFVIDLCLLGLWCVITYFEFASDWHVASPIGYILMIGSLVMMFFQINYATAWGIIAFFADVAAAAFLVTAVVSYVRNGTFRPR